MSVAVEQPIQSPISGQNGSEGVSPLAELGRELTRSVPLSETEPGVGDAGEVAPEPAEAEADRPETGDSQPEPNLWDEICKEFAAKRPPFNEGTVEEVLQPATPTPPPRKSCSPREFLEYYIFPVLLPALEDMLKQAKLERCFERKRTKFNALDFLTESMYRNNPFHNDREGMELADIPFVQEHWKEHPRPPLPKSLLWSEDEAILIIQNFWRGYLVRREPDVQELRQWQREWRQENEDISETVSDFWAKQMPDGDPLSPCASQELLADTDGVDTLSREQLLASGFVPQDNVDTRDSEQQHMPITPPTSPKSQTPPVSAPKEKEVEQTGQNKQDP